MRWTVNLAIEHLHTLFPAICSGLRYIELAGDLLRAPVTLQEAFGLVPSNSILSFWHWNVAKAQEDLGIASQLQKRGVVVGYFIDYLFYMQFGWWCDWVSNAKLSKRFCTR